MASKRSAPDNDQVLEKKQKTTTVALSPTQQQVLDVVKSGKSIFFTGAAGAGKSYLLKHIIEYFESNDIIVYVTASTGVAAVPLHGSTLHSFAGIGLGDDPTKKPTTAASTRWRDAQALIIDEVSMVDGDYFDRINQIAKIARQSMEPFGGIQVILSGDFLQLPPITMKGQPLKKFIFETKTWKECIGDRMYRLDTIFRQSEDPNFINLLNEIRVGQTPPYVRGILDQCKNRFTSEQLSTKLYAKKDKVDAENNKQLALLQGTDPVTFTSQYYGQASSVELLKKNSIGPESIILKKDARVMLVKNIETESGLVNGSCGTIIGWSHAKSANDHLDKRWSAVNSHTKWPNVKFDNGITRVITPDRWTIEERKRVLAEQVQIPLILSYALTSQKAQGMTLDRATVELADIFTDGQAYVMLSRVRSLDTLSIEGYIPYWKIRADQRALTFYRDLNAIIRDRESEQYEEEQKAIMPFYRQLNYEPQMKQDEEEKKAQIPSKEEEEEAYAQSVSDLFAAELLQLAK